MDRLPMFWALSGQRMPALTTTLSAYTHFDSLHTANALGGVIAYGVLRMGGVGGLPILGWQWLFILEGALPVVLGLATMALLPDHPSSCR